MYRLSKFDELVARDYKARADVMNYMGQKQRVVEKFNKKMRRPNKRLQKKITTNERGDKETQRLNLLAAGEDNEELKNEIQELRRKFPEYTSMYDSNKIPMLKK